MSKNNYKCLINSSAPRCVIIITINTGINHSYTISSMARSKHITSHQHSNTLPPTKRGTEHPEKALQPFVVQLKM